MYAQYSHDIEPYLHYIDCLSNITNNRHLIIATDINAWSTRWFSNTTNVKGEMVNQHLDLNNLFVANSPNQPPTYRGPCGTSSRIDITVVNSKTLPLVTGWRVLDGTRTHIDETQRRLCFDKADRSKLQHIIEDAHINELMGSVDLRAHALTTILQTAQNSSVPTAKLNKNRSPWNNRLTALRQDSRRMRTWYQRAKTEQEKRYWQQLYLTAKKTYKGALLQTRQQHWNTHTEQQIQTNIWGEPFKICTERIKTPFVLSTLKREDGTNTEGWRSSAEYLLNKLLPDDTNTVDDAFHTTPTLNMTTMPSPFLLHRKRLPL